MTSSPGWGIYREVTHSPGRESDDEQILRLTAKHLEGLGLPVILRSPDDVPADGPRPGFVFFMCERVTLLERLGAWEREGIPHVNPVAGVLNTYRDRMIARFTAAGVDFVPSRLVATAQAPDPVDVPVWVKRADVHNTQAGDVVRAETPGEVTAALRALAARGIARAVLQPHVDGDLVKFYGVGTHPTTAAEPAWFRWFHHQHQRLAHHPFDAAHLARLARRAADALGLEVYGGDAIATADGVVLLDVNAWPSFARVREEAAAQIAAHVARRVERGGR